MIVEATLTETSTDREYSYAETTHVDIDLDEFEALAREQGFIPEDEFEGKPAYAAIHNEFGQVWVNEETGRPSCLVAELRLAFDEARMAPIVDWAANLLKPEYNAREYVLALVEEDEEGEEWITLELCEEISADGSSHTEEFLDPRFWERRRLRQPQQPVEPGEGKDEA